MRLGVLFTMLKRVLLFAVPLLALLLLVGLRVRAVQGKAAELKGDAGKRKGGTPAVETALAGAQIIERQVSLVGSAESPFVVKLSPRVAGRIVSLDVREGDRVSPGQVLVRLDPTDIEAAITGARAAVGEARARLAQAQATAGATAVGATTGVATARAGVARSAAELNQAQRNVASHLAGAQAAVAEADARIAAANADARSADAGVASAQANLTNARTQFARTKKLYDGGFIAAQDLDNAAAGVKVQEANVAAAKANAAGKRNTATSLGEAKRAAQAQLSITRRAAQTGVTSAKANLGAASAALQAAQANTSQTSAYASNLAALRSAVAASEASLQQAEARRLDAALASPIEGTVTARDGDVGALASPATPVLTVQYLKWLYFAAGVSVDDAARVAKGMRATVAFEALPGKSFVGRVAELNGAADPLSRQVGVRVRLENPREIIRPGMFGRMTLTLERVEAPVAVPPEAITEPKEGMKGEATVTVIGADGKASVRSVRLGARSDRFVQITGGLKAGERVVTLAYNPVKDGQEVKTGEGKPKGEKKK